MPTYASAGGGFADAAPYFCVFVTGHKDAIPYGWWFHAGHPGEVLNRPEVMAHAARLVAYLDGVLRGKRATHRISLHCRDDATGVDHVVRAYAARRGIFCLPVGKETGRWGELAHYRRDAETVIRSDAVVWFGERESDNDPVWISETLGVTFRVVPTGDG